MKILLCNTTDTGGGAATAACRLLGEFVRQNVNASLLVLIKKSQHAHIVSVDEICDESVFSKLLRDARRKLNYYYTGFRWRQYKNKKNINLNDTFISFIGNSLKQVEFDILHLHWIEGGFINFTELQKINKPIVWTIHGSFPFTGICHHLLCEKYKTQCGVCPALGSDKKYDFSTENFELKRKRYTKLDFHIVSPSRFMADRARESALLGKRPIHVIPNGLNTVTFSPVDKQIARGKLEIPDKKTIVFGAYRATTDENKGFKYLLEGLKKLKEYHESHEIQILIFGGAYEGDLFFDTVNLGQVENEEVLSTVYSSADVMIVPSEHENLPYTIMESLSCATPVVAFDIGGNSDMLEHKINGYLVKPFDVSELAEGIHWCIENNINNKLGDNGRKKVLDNFRIEDVASQYEKLYRSIISNSTKENK